MDRPDFTRRQAVDRFFDEYGLDVYDGLNPDVPTGTGFCGLESRPLADGRLLVVAYEYPDNPGRSVTNAAEDIAQQFGEAAGVEVSRLVWVESYAAERSAGEPGSDRCTLARDPIGESTSTLLIESRHQIGTLHTASLEQCRGPRCRTLLYRSDKEFNRCLVAPIRPVDRQSV